MTNDQMSKIGQCASLMGRKILKGVAPIIPKELTQYFELIDVKNVLLLNFKIDGLQYILIYCPKKENPSGQNYGYDYLYEIVESYSTKNIIIGGNLNTYTEPIDKLARIVQ